MWTQSHFSSVFQSHSFDWFVFCLAIIVLPSHKHNSPSGMQWISWWLLGDMVCFSCFWKPFFLLPSLTSCLGAWLYHRGEPPHPSASPHSFVRSSYITSILGSHGRPGLGFLNENLKRTHNGQQECFSSISQYETKPTYETLREDGGRLEEVAQM